MLMATLTAGALFLGATRIEKPLRVEENRRTEKREQKTGQRKMIVPIKGADESTRLPDTARVEARGGVLI